MTFKVDFSAISAGIAYVDSFAPIISANSSEPFGAESHLYVRAEVSTPSFGDTAAVTVLPGTTCTTAFPASVIETFPSESEESTT